jgi:hypothetical protein
MSTGAASSRIDHLEEVFKAVKPCVLAEPLKLSHTLKTKKLSPFFKMI